MSSSAFIIEHIIRVALNCNISSIHISDNNADGKLLEFYFDASAALKDILEITNAMNNHGDYYINNNILTIYCHIMPNGIISNRAEM